MQSNKKSFKGQTVYIGIDVHLKKWSVTCLTESNFKRTIEQPPHAKALLTFLEHTFPDANYEAAYEAGFSGFSSYYDLERHGIRCIVVNAADIPSTQYDKVMKTDSVDSEKLAMGLKSGQLRGIYVRAKDDLDDVSLVRFRKAVRREESANKVRIRMLLHSHGVEIPPQFSKRWSRAYAAWLRTEVKLLSSTKETLRHLVDHVEMLHLEYLKANRAVRNLWRTDKYRPLMELLVSIPGIGATTAITLLTEIGDFSRFSNERQFASYLGLIPTCHNSGEKVLQRTITFRGNSHIGSVLVEACWKSIAKDVSLAAFYGRCCKRMGHNKAIVKVARKLSNIILAVMKHKTKYDPAKVR